MTKSLSSWIATVKTRIAWLGFVAISAASLAGCDPGFAYRPRDWTAVTGTEATWTISIDAVTIQHRGLRGLIGDESISTEFEIHNNSPFPLVLERAELVTHGVRRTGQLPDNGALAARTISSRATDRIAVLWNLSEPAYRSLGSAPQIVIEFRLNDRTERLAISYDKTS